MILIDGVLYPIINVLLLLMASAGPTPVAGTNGTTAAFLVTDHAAAADRPAHVAVMRAR